MQRLGRSQMLSACHPTPVISTSIDCGIQASCLAGGRGSRSSTSHYDTMNARIAYPTDCSGRKLECKPVGRGDKGKKPTAQLRSRGRAKRTPRTRPCEGNRASPNERAPRLECEAP